MVHVFKAIAQHIAIRIPEKRIGGDFESIGNAVVIGVNISGSDEPVLITIPRPIVFLSVIHPIVVTVADVRIDSCKFFFEIG